MIGQDPIALPVLELIDVFRDELSSVSFPGVDHAMLESLAVEVREHATEVARARALVESTGGALEESRRTLAHAAVRGLAYARVYADSDSVLAQRLASIALPETAHPPPLELRVRKAETKPRSPRRKRGLVVADSELLRVEGDVVELEATG